MSWQIEWTDRAVRDADVLDRRTRERILRSIERLAGTGHGDVKRLQGYESEWRLRVGSWRVRFAFDHGSSTIYILRILPRGSGYRD